MTLKEAAGFRLVMRLVVPSLYFAQALKRGRPSGISLSTTSEDMGESQCTTLTVPCLVCDKLLHARSVRHHRALHRTLTTLQYRAGKVPVSLLSLRIRRRGIISKKARSKKWNCLELEKIDFAYEMARSQRLSTWPFLREPPIVCTEEPELPFTMPWRPCIKPLGVCQDMNPLWKSQMEDVYVFMDSYGGQSGRWFIGLFDGFHGSTAAQFVSKDLPLLILQQLNVAGSPYELSEEEHAYLSGYNTIFPRGAEEKLLIAPIYSAAAESQGPKDSLCGPIHMAFAKAFWKMDRILRLGRNERSKVRWSGCTATTCLFEPSVSETQGTTGATDGNVGDGSDSDSSEIGTLHIANAGDVHAILCKNGKGYRLTGNHSTSNRKERKRIRQTGGTISKNEQYGLVEGITQSTRGLGYHGDPKLKTSLVPIPYTISIPIDSSCQFLVLASSGFWKALNKHEAVSIALQMLSFYSGSFHGRTKDIDSLDTIIQSEQNIDFGHSILHLLDEFNQQGHNDAVISTEHLFQELLNNKKYNIKREQIIHLLKEHSIRDVHNNVWKTIDHLLQDVVMNEESSYHIEHGSVDSQSTAQHSGNIPTKSLFRNSGNELQTTPTKFPQKFRPEMEVKDKDPIEKLSEETSTKLEYIVDNRTSDVNLAENISPTENKTKQKSSNVQIEATLPETINTETYTMNQGGNIQVTSQETELQYETIAKTISERLVRTAKLAGACDNITVLILLFPGCTKTFS